MANDSPTFAAISLRWFEWVVVVEIRSRSSRPAHNLREGRDSIERTKSRFYFWRMSLGSRTCVVGQQIRASSFWKDLPRRLTVDRMSKDTSSIGRVDLRVPMKTERKRMSLRLPVCSSFLLKIVSNSKMVLMNSMSNWRTVSLELRSEVKEKRDSMGKNQLGDGSTDWYPHSDRLLWWFPKRRDRWTLRSTHGNQRTNLAARNSFRICSTDLFPKAISVDRALARI